MDVRCEKCGTEYEFEDQRITEEGVTVKCSTCGHLFKIRRKSFVLTEPVTLEKKPLGEAERQWIIRKTDGSILNFKELTTLQKWIVEQKVSREDEISRSGESWKKLGSIPELASFFQIVDQAMAAHAASTSPAMRASIPQVAPYLSTPPSQTQPMPAAIPPPAASIYSAPPSVPVPQAPAAIAPVQGSPVASAPAPAATAPAQPSVPPPEAKPGEKIEPDTWGEAVPEEVDDVVEKWKKRSRRKWWLITPLVLLLAALGGWYLFDRASFEKVLNRLFSRTPEVPPQVEQALEESYGLILKDTAEGYRQAREKLQQALEQTQGKLPRALLLLALLHVGRADGVRPQVDQLEAEIAKLQQKEDQLKPKDGSEAKGKLFEEIAAIHNRKVDLQKERVVLVDGARKDLEEARRYLEQAAAQEAANPLLALVRADYRRVLGGDRGQVENELAPARAAPKGLEAWLAFAEGALLAEDPQQAAAAEQKLRAALAAEPRLTRARMGLARLLFSQKKYPEAEAELQNLLGQNQEHQGARKFLEQLQVASAPPSAPESEKPAPEQNQPAAPAAAYEELLRQARALQDQGHCTQALAAFDKALEQKPQSIEALTGKGLCYLDLGNYQAAISWFQKALKVNPRYGEAIIGLAETYKYQGNLEEARKFYRNYLEVLPNGPEAAVARRNLE
jgi:predicted Zn finger-like uncharacterized protein